LNAWADHHRNDILAGLGPDLILFGEWLAAHHSVPYSNLPDWFVAFDVYDRMAGRFWRASRRDALIEQVGLKVVPSLFHGGTKMAALRTLVMKRESQFGTAALEGLIIRQDGEWFNESRGKLVRPDFIQDIGGHWRRRQMEWNRIGAT
jgi:ATP-dependent RNA circularization protein (DNA/RNA ligase family)